MRKPSIALCVGAVASLLFAQQAQALNVLGLLQSWIDRGGQLVSSYRVVAKQISVSSDKVATSELQSSSAGITAIIANRQANQVRNAVVRFSDQGVYPCYQSDVSILAGEGSKKTAVAVRDASTAMAGWDVGNETSRRADQIVLHKAVYCSVSEHVQGICKLNATGLQSADSDFSMLVKPGTKSTSEREAAYDYIDNILTQRQAVQCASPECASQAQDARAMNAVESMARTSFMSMVEARSQQVTTPSN